jgi:4-hydroxybenzoate polyprenyltransferase
VEKLKAVTTLMRVRHTGQVVGIVLVLSVKSYGISAQSIYAIISFLFLCIALFSFDDAHDYISDSIIHPSRPIPKGIFSVNEVYLIGIISFCLGILVAFGLMLYQFSVFLLVAVLGFSVIFLKLSPILKATFTASMIFLLFPFSTPMNLKSILFGLIVALPHFASSISKDFIHSKGDIRIGLQPPVEWTRYLASFTFFADGIIILIPIFLKLVSWSYIPLSLPTIVSCLILGKKMLTREYQKVYIYGSIAMISSLLSIAINI